jgi:hypothetical protein
MSECTKLMAMYGTLAVFLFVANILIFTTMWPSLPKFWGTEGTGTTECSIMPILYWVVMAELLGMIALLFWASFARMK